MIPYEKFAAVYDKMGHDRFSLRMAEYTLKLLKKFKAEPLTGLDLCCGTGTAIETLSEHGLIMSGLDGSKQMLTVARKKLKSHRVKLYRQKLPRFNIVANSSTGRNRRLQFDLVTCFFDSLNYLRNERELAATFKAVYRHLRPGGWFVFDMNTPHMLRAVFANNQPYAGTQKDVAWIFSNEQPNDGATGEFDLTFFVKEGRSWKRYDEHHRETAYSNSVVRKRLNEAGFRVRGFYNCSTFERPSRTSKRIAVAAQRPG